MSREIVETFPIQDGPSVPWSFMAPHEAQCRINHGHSASIKHIAERGGFGAAEAWCVVNGLKFYDALPDQKAIDEARRKWFELAERVNREWSIGRLLADEREHGRQEANGDWLSCLIGRTGDTSYGELAGSILNVSDALTRFTESIVSSEREKVREMLYDIKTLVDNQAEDAGLWYRAQTAAEGYVQQELRKLHAVIEHQLDLTAPSSTEEGKG